MRRYTGSINEALSAALIFAYSARFKKKDKKITTTGVGSRSRNQNKKRRNKRRMVKQSKRNNRK